MLWIALHLPALSLESLAATLGPAQAGQPLALIENHQVLQANAAASACGIRPGMKRATALALAPALVLGQACALRDAAALTAVAHVALAYTPAVTLAGAASQASQAGQGGQGQASGTGVRLEVQASLRYFGGLATLLQRLRAALLPLGHQAQLATAPTAAGATLLARWRGDLESGPHTTDLQALRSLLDAAPVWLLAAGRRHWAVLQGMGLHTLADLRQLPRSGLARRFGPELLDELDQARGDLPQPHVWLALPPRFDSRLELFARADTTAQVAHGAHILLARLVAWAQARQGRIARCTLHMHHESLRQRDGAPAPGISALDIAPAEPAADAAHLQMLLDERLARLAMAAPALELSLHCDALVAGVPPNAELFPTQANARTGLVRLVERLQARLGRGQVQHLVTVQDHRPERATQWQPANAAALPNLVATALPAPAMAMPPRPLWLLAQACPLDCRAGAPVFEGRPLRLVAGPERIEAGWWDQGLAARDYYIAAMADGALLWVYRARLPSDADGHGQGRNWFLQGRFA